MKKEVSMFLGATFLLSWMLWGMVIVFTRNEIVALNSPLIMILFILGGNVPAIYEIWAKRCFEGKIQLSRFIKSIISPKLSAKWYIFIIIMVSCNSILQVIFNDGFNGIMLKKPIYYILLTLPIMVIGGGLEEIGWRGFLLPKLQMRINSLASTIVVGVLWALWHLPLWLIPGTNQVNIQLASFIINAIAFSFLLTTIYNKTKSVFLCIFCHALINSFMEVIPWSNSLSGNSAVLLLNITVFTVMHRSYFAKDNRKSPGVFNGEVQN